MGDRLFLSEYTSKTRTAQVFQRLTEKDFVVFCFCCGQETETDPFESQSLAENWAKDWLLKQVELATMNTLSEHQDCNCN